MHRSSIPVSHFDIRSYYNNVNCVHEESLVLQQILYKTTCCRSLDIGCIVEPLNQFNVNFDYKARVEMINHPFYAGM